MDVLEASFLCPAAQMPSLAYHESSRGWRRACSALVVLGLAWSRLDCLIRWTSIAKLAGLLGIEGLRVKVSNTTTLCRHKRLQYCTRKTNSTESPYKRNSGE